MCLGVFREIPLSTIILLIRDLLLEGTPRRTCVCRTNCSLHHCGSNRGVATMVVPLLRGQATESIGKVDRYPTTGAVRRAKLAPCFGVAMANVPQDPWDAIKAIALEVRAPAHDEASGELVCNDDPQADKRLYARTFEDWAADKIDGSAQVIIATISEILSL